MIAHHFDAVPDAIVTWQEFLQYHCRMSIEVDRSRSIDRDAWFIRVVERAWRLDQNPDDALEPTGVFPETLDAPKGLAQTRNMDLLWPDEKKPGALKGYKVAVKPTFARKDMPKAIRGYFTLQSETETIPKTFLPPRGALLPPMSIVFEREDGPAAMIVDVVSSNVDPSELPPALRAIILTRDEATARGATPLVQQKLFNPIYKKSSEVFGEGSDARAQEVLELKRKAFAGDNAGQIWLGRTGKFSDEFRGGVYRNDSLNVTFKPDNRKKV